MVPRTQATFTPVKRSATLRFSDRVPTQAGFARKVSFRGLELMHRIRFRPAEYSYTRLQDWQLAPVSEYRLAHVFRSAVRLRLLVGMPTPVHDDYPGISSFWARTWLHRVSHLTESSRL